MTQAQTVVSLSDAAERNSLRKERSVENGAHRAASQNSMKSSRSGSTGTRHSQKSDISSPVSVRAPQSDRRSQADSEAYSYAFELADGTDLSREVTITTARSDSAVSDKSGVSTISESKVSGKSSADSITSARHSDKSPKSATPDIENMEPLSQPLKSSKFVIKSVNSTSPVTSDVASIKCGSPHSIKTGAGSQAGHTDTSANLQSGLDQLIADLKDNEHDAEDNTPSNTLSRTGFFSPMLDETTSPLGRDKNDNERREEGPMSGISKDKNRSGTSASRNSKASRAMSDKSRDKSVTPVRNIGSSVSSQKKSPFATPTKSPTKSVANSPTKFPTNSSATNSSAKSSAKSSNKIVTPAERGPSSVSGKATSTAKSPAVKIPSETGDSANDQILVTGSPIDSILSSSGDQDITPEGHSVTSAKKADDVTADDVTAVDDVAKTSDVADFAIPTTETVKADFVEGLSPTPVTEALKSSTPVVDAVVSMAPADDISKSSTPASAITVSPDKGFGSESITTTNDMKAAAPTIEISQKNLTAAESVTLTPDDSTPVVDNVKISSPIDAKSATLNVDDIYTPINVLKSTSPTVDTMKITTNSTTPVVVKSTTPDVDPTKTIKPGTDTSPIVEVLGSSISSPKKVMTTTAANSVSPTDVTKSATPVAELSQSTTSAAAESVTPKNPAKCATPVIARPTHGESSVQSRTSSRHASGSTTRGSTASSHVSSASSHFSRVSSKHPIKCSERRGSSAEKADNDKSESSRASSKDSSSHYVVENEIDAPPDTKNVQKSKHSEASSRASPKADFRASSGLSAKRGGSLADKAADYLDDGRESDSDKEADKVVLNSAKSNPSYSSSVASNYYKHDDNSEEEDREEGENMVLSRASHNPKASSRKSSRHSRYSSKQPLKASSRASSGHKSTDEDSSVKEVQYISDEETVTKPSSAESMKSKTAQVISDYNSSDASDTEYPSKTPGEPGPSNGANGILVTEAMSIESVVKSDVSEDKRKTGEDAPHYTPLDAADLVPQYSPLDNDDFIETPHVVNDTSKAPKHRVYLKGEARPSISRESLQSHTSNISAGSGRELKSKNEYIEEKKYLRSLAGDDSEIEFPSQQGSRGVKSGKRSGASSRSSKSKISENADNSDTEAISDSPSDAAKRSKKSSKSSSTLNVSDKCLDDNEDGVSLADQSPGRSNSRSKPMGIIGFDLEDDPGDLGKSSDDEPYIPAIERKKGKSSTLNQADDTQARPVSSASNKSRILSAQEFAKVASRASTISSTTKTSVKFTRNKDHSSDSDRTITPSKAKHISPKHSSRSSRSHASSKHSAMRSASLKSADILPKPESESSDDSDEKVIPKSRASTKASSIISSKGIAVSSKPSSTASPKRLYQHPPHSASPDLNSALITQIESPVGKSDECSSESDDYMPAKSSSESDAPSPGSEARSAHTKASSHMSSKHRVTHHSSSSDSDIEPAELSLLSSRATSKANSKASVRATSKPSSRVSSKVTSKASSRSTFKASSRPTSKASSKLSSASSYYSEVTKHTTSQSPTSLTPVSPALPYISKTKIQEKLRKSSPEVIQLPHIIALKRPKAPPMSRESTSIRSLEIVRERLRAERQKTLASTRSKARVGASLGPYCATDYVIELINQPERLTNGIYKARATSLNLIQASSELRIDRGEFLIDRQSTVTSLTGKRPQPIPAKSDALPLFPRISTIVPFKAAVRGKVNYHDMPKVRESIAAQQRAVIQNRSQVQYELAQQNWPRFQIARISSNVSTNHFLRAAASYLSNSEGSNRAMREAMATR